VTRLLPPLLLSPVARSPVGGVFSELTSSARVLMARLIALVIVAIALAACAGHVADYIPTWLGGPPKDCRLGRALRNMTPTGRKWTPTLPAIKARASLNRKPILESLFCQIASGLAASSSQTQPWRPHALRRSRTVQDTCAVMPTAVSRMRFIAFAQSSAVVTSSNTNVNVGDESD
jgi:hypothetical protein